MKKFFTSLIACSLLLTGCSFLSNLPSGDNDKEEKISSFEFVTDNMMTLDSSGEDHSFYLLTMYVGDTYQLKTNIDEKMGSNYHFEYTDYNETIDTVSSSGLVSALRKGVDSVRTNLYRNKDSKRITYKSFVINVKEPSSEYANITINDSTLPYNEETKTYSLTLNAGDSYYIPTSISYNVAYNKVFELENDSYSSFMAVDSSGRITTQEVLEDKDGRVVIKTTSTDGSKIYDTIYLKVHINKIEVLPPEEDELEVTNLDTGLKLNDGDNLNLYVNDSVSFGVKYRKDNKYGVLAVSDSDVLELDNDLNKITAKKVGKSDVTFSYEEKSLTIHVEVVKNSLVEIYSKNGADDFIIVNGNLFILGRLFAKYQNGIEVDITKSNNLSNSITNLDSTYKSVTFSYTEDEENKTVTYNVLYFVTENYVADETAYNLSDYFNNKNRNKCFILPNEGVFHMLVIPVWFTNSTSFFRENQKEEILGDLEYVYNSTREKDDFHSVKQFYEEESNGKVIFDITISEFYESGTTSKNYGDTVEADIKNTHTLADNAIEWYFDSHSSESLSDYDSNNDGLVDAVSLVYAANYYGTIGDANGTTAFEFTNTQGSTHKYNNGSFSPIGGIYGFGKNADLSRQLNVTDLSTYYPSYYFTSGCRTIIHETGHMFGFFDLYEDNHAETKYYPAGRFNMQSSDMGGHDPYQMNLIGWSKPQIYSASNFEIGDTITVNIDAFASNGNNILLTREMNDNNSLFDEYLLLELLAPTGLNYYDAKNSAYTFSQAGIRLWHVNSILENMSSSNKETSEISNSNWINLKYSNNDQSSECDLAHWIRNNEEEPYNTVSTVKNSYGLFMSGDHFDMDTFKSQFINEGKLDNKEKLGWEFDVNSVYHTVDDEFGAVITLTRVENERVDFEFSTRINKDIGTQPTEDGNDYALELLGDNGVFSLIYNFNNAAIPGYYTQDNPISTKGVCLFSSPDGEGGSLVITIKDKNGYIVRIASISITYSILTKASVTAFVDGQVVTGTSFTGPYNDMDGYNEKGLTFDVNSNSITLQNKYTGENDCWSVLAIYSVTVNYHIERI